MTRCRERQRFVGSHLDNHLINVVKKTKTKQNNFEFYIYFCLCFCTDVMNPVCFMFVRRWKKILMMLFQKGDVNRWTWWRSDTKAAHMKISIFENQRWPEDCPCPLTLSKVRKIIEMLKATKTGRDLHISFPIRCKILWNEPRNFSVGRMEAISSVNISGLRGIWDGPSQSGIINCDHINQYSRCFFLE